MPKWETHMWSFFTAVLGNAGKFSLYWVIAVLVMGLGFYAPVADYVSMLQNFNLEALKWVASKLPYYLSSPVLVKLRGFVQSEAFVTTEVVAAAVGVLRFFRWCFTDPDKNKK